MGVLDQITQMKGQGIAEEEIVSKLQEQGVSPKAINDAISQSQIKNAVAGQGTESMQPSIMQSESMGNPPQPSTKQNPQAYAAQTREISAPQEAYAPQEYYQDSYDGYAPEAYDTDTMIEIAEQVFLEKIKKIQKQVTEINEFKTLTQTKVDNMADRLKRIETTLDKLQLSILDKVGSYGKNLESIKKEMEMIENSFGKVLNKTTHTPKSVPKTPTKHTKKAIPKKK